MELGIKPKRALIVNHCGLFLPSGMVRALQYEPYFKNSPDWDAVFTTRLSEYFTRLNADRRLATRIVLKPVRRTLARLKREWEERQADTIVNQANEFDIVSFIKSPGIELYERTLKRGRAKVIMDINDAIWMPAFNFANLPETLSIVHGVICESEYLASYVRQYNSRVFVIPDSPQVEIFDQYRDSIRRDPRKLTIGWIGGAQNIGPLLQILEPLEFLFERYPQLQLRVVGADASQFPQMRHIRYSCRPTFDQEEMVREVLGFDIGLFPLFHNDDGRARGTLKALVYMSGKAAVVAENFGDNSNLIQDGVNGMLAGSLHEWRHKLEYLITKTDERSAIAERGLETVRKGFSAGHIFQKILAAYDCVLSDGGVNVDPPKRS